MILIRTIEGAGSHSLQKHLDGGRIDHFAGSDIDPDDYDEVHTTYRNPLEVGVTWANRQMKSLNCDHVRNWWFNSWREWVEQMPGMVLHDVKDLPDKEHRGEDKLNLYGALARGDMVYYYHFIPKHFIDFAQMCVRVVRG